MYQASNASRDMISRLRGILGGGGGSSAPNPLDALMGASGRPSPSGLGTIPQNPFASNNFLADVLGDGPISGNLRNLGGQQANQAPEQPTQQDYVEQFLQSMAANMNGGAGSGLNQADYEEALKNSAAQIKGAFGAEIGAVKASSASARHQTKRSKQQVKAMYKALSNEYNQAAQAEVGQGQQIANAIQGVANNATAETKNSSDAILNEQAALAQGLGVQSALPGVVAKQESQIANQIGNIQQYGGRSASDQLSNSGTQQRYLQRGGNNALLEGTNRRADLVQQLQAFLQQNMGKIADIKGQRGQALAANSASVAKSFGDAAANAQQDNWAKQKDMAGLLLSLRGQNASQGKSAASAAQQKQDQLMEYLKLLSSTAGQTHDPKTMAQVMKYIEDAMKASAGG